MNSTAGSRPTAVWRIVLAALLLQTALLSAQEPREPARAEARPPAPAVAPAVYPAPAADSQRVAYIAMYFVVLVALAGAGIYLLRNGLPIRGVRSGDARKLQIVEMRALGNRQFLLVVEYEQNRMLLGVTSGRIDYLCPLDAASGGRFEAPTEPAVTA